MKPKVIVAEALARAGIEELSHSADVIDASGWDRAALLANWPMPRAWSFARLPRSMPR